jgi:dephospho-CoA kinase
MTLDGTDVREAAARLAAQLPAEEKARRADYVIRTDGTYEDTNRQVRAVFDQLVAKASG